MAKACLSTALILTLFAVGSSAEEAKVNTTKTESGPHASDSQPPCNCDQTSNDRSDQAKLRTSICVCDKYPIFYLGTSWLYFADLYQHACNPDDCSNPEEAYDEQLQSDISEDCDMGTCHAAAFARTSSTSPHLTTVKDVTYDIAAFRRDLYSNHAHDPHSQNPACEASGGMLVEFFTAGTPGKIFRARLFVVTVALADGSIQQFPLGVELNHRQEIPTGVTEYPATTTGLRPGYSHVYDVKYGMTTYHVITQQ